MSQVAAPSDRRFRRAHVKPARKRKHLRALAAPLFGCGLIGLIVAYGLYRGSSAAVHARILPITRIVVRATTACQRERCSRC